MTAASALTPAPFCEVHLRWLLEQNIRAKDAEECWAISGQGPAESLRGALQGSGPKYIVFGTVDGHPTPVGAFGIALPEDRHHGTPAIWSLWTDALDGPMKRCILRNTRKWVVRLLDEAGVGVACNYVLDSNKLAVSWLRASGCFNIAEETDLVGEARKSMRYFQTKPRKVLTSNV